MGDYEADTLRDTLFTAWALTGNLQKADAKQRGDYCEFYGNNPVDGNENHTYVKVKKLTAIEGVTERPHVEEVRDEFEISCYRISAGTNEDERNIYEKEVEDMCNEVVRIVKTVYSPLSEIGVFFTTVRDWRNEDELNNENQPYLKRTMRLTLTRLRAKSTKTFLGYSFTVLFDVSESEGTGLPGSDYSYATVYNVEITGGFTNKKRLTSTHPDGKGIGVSFRGIYHGRFLMEVYADRDDVVGSGTHLLNNINSLLSSGEVPEIVLLTNAKNTEAVPGTLTVSTKLRVTDFPISLKKEDLVVFQVIGDVLRPPVLTVA